MHNNHRYKYDILRYHIEFTWGEYAYIYGLSAIHQSHKKIISSLPKKLLQDQAVNDWVRYNFSVQKDNDIVVYRIRDLTSIEGSACGLITQPTIKNGVTYIPLTNNKESSLKELKEIWKDVGLCPNDNIANYFAQYAYQAGFTDALATTLYKIRDEYLFLQVYSNITRVDSIHHDFEVHNDHLVFCSKQVFYGIRLYSSNNSLSFKEAIEIATSIKIYTGKEVSDNTRLHDPKIGYFGPVRKQTLDSWFEYRSNYTSL